MSAYTRWSVGFTNFRLFTRTSEQAHRLAEYNSNLNPTMTFEVRGWAVTSNKLICKYLAGQRREA